MSQSGGASRTGAEPAKTAGREPAIAVVRSAPMNGRAGPVATAAKPGAPAPKPPVTIGGGAVGSVNSVAETSTWKGAPTRLQGVSGEFFPVRISLADSASPAFVPTVSSCISLSNVQQQIELRMMIATDEASARALAQQLVCEDNLELATDMLSELANTHMGSLKSSFAKEGLSFTGGIPKLFECGPKAPS